MRISYVVLILLTVATFGTTQSPQKLKLSAPAYYIAADSDFKELPGEMRIRAPRTSPRVRDSELTSTTIAGREQPDLTKTRSPSLAEMASLK
jgi:hypothetical protein